jgi:predicted transposase YdaD
MTYLSSLERFAIDRGLKQGLQEGLQAGRQAGRQEGLRELLLTQLDKRFGSLDDSVRARLAAADAEALSAWALNFVDAATLEQVFRDK